MTTTSISDGNSTVNQRIKGEFVAKHVYCNVNQMVEYILRLNASKNLANLALLRNPEEVKLVEQTQIQDLSCGVALKQEFLLNNNLNN